MVGLLRSQDREGRGGSLSKGSEIRGGGGGGGLSASVADRAGRPVWGVNSRTEFSLGKIPFTVDKET